MKQHDISDPNKIERAVETSEVFSTFPLADAYEVEPESNQAIPSPDDVKEAKDWVDFNEK